MTKYFFKNNLFSFTLDHKNVIVVFHLINVHSSFAFVLSSYKLIASYVTDIIINGNIPYNYNNACNFFKKKKKIL